MRMAASAGSARRPFTATRWKPPANHMVRMMALSRTSTTLQQKRSCQTQAWRGTQPHCPHPIRDCANPRRPAATVTETSEEGREGGCAFFPPTVHVGSRTLSHPFTQENGSRLSPVTGTAACEKGGPQDKTRDTDTSVSSQHPKDISFK